MSAAGSWKLKVEVEITIFAKRTFENGKQFLQTTLTALIKANVFSTSIIIYFGNGCVTCCFGIKDFVKFVFGFFFSIFFCYVFHCFILYAFLFIVNYYLWC